FMSKVLTAFWGVLAVGFALYADLFENLIEAVNILGSLFYGTILGIFLTAFFLKRVKGNAVFIAAAIAEATILIIYTFQSENISYLYFNVIGCGLVMILAYVFSIIEGNKKAINE
ncbi:MAG: sodium:solute symporter, partial [Cryomorphaceae bacterium]